MFDGVIVALVTPFKDGEVDFETISELVEFHIEQGTDGIVPVGTTGECATLSHEEHDQVVARVVEAVKGRVPVIAGAGSNATKEAIRLTRHAKEAGADAALSVAPYYNKPTQEGLFLHFRAIAKDGGLPLVLYNVPGRTKSDILPETVERLVKAGGIAAVKEASGDVDRVSALARRVPDIDLLSGEDALTLPILAAGGAGVISVVANLVPADLKAMIAAYREGNVEKARDRHLALFPLMKAMFYETNPIPVKAAMARLGRIEEAYRLPLSPLSEANRKRLEQALQAYGLL